MTNSTTRFQVPAIRTLLMAALASLASLALLGCGKDGSEGQKQLLRGYDEAGLRANCEPRAEGQSCAQPSADFVEACHQAGYQMVECSDCQSLCSGQITPRQNALQ